MSPQNSGKDTQGMHSRGSARTGTTLQSRGSTVKAASPVSPYTSPQASPNRSRRRSQPGKDSGVVLSNNTTLPRQLTAGTWVSLPDQTPSQVDFSLLDSQSLISRRSLVGLHCTPEIGQRVVGVQDSAFENLGIGTVVNVDESRPGVVSVRWDRERDSARQPSEYCAGLNGVYHLELAQKEDLWLGSRYKAKGPDLFSTSRTRLESSGVHYEFSGSSNLDRVHSSSSKEFLKRKAGRRHSKANFQSSVYNAKMKELFFRFARGSKRKRFKGYDLRNLQKKSIQSMNLAELTQVVEYFNDTVDRPFMGKLVSAEDIKNQYNAVAPWSLPEAYGELDLQRFIFCIEAIAMLAGIPLGRLVCHPPYNPAEAQKRREGRTSESVKSADDSDIEATKSEIFARETFVNPLPFIPASSKHVAAIATQREFYLNDAEHLNTSVSEEISTTKFRAKQDMNDFVSRLHALHLEERAREKSLHEWSRKFIINKFATPWYAGREHKFWINARNPEELASKLNDRVHLLLDVEPTHNLVIKYNTTSRSDLVAGRDAKWHTINVDDIKVDPIPGGGHGDPGTFLRVLREEDIEAAKERAQALWAKMRSVVKELRLKKRSEALSGLAAAAHQGLLKTMQTGGRQWIQGTVQREKLKDALASFSAKIASEQVQAKAANADRVHGEDALLKPFLAKAKRIALRSGRLYFQQDVKVDFRAAAGFGKYYNVDGQLFWAEPRNTLAFTSHQSLGSEGKIHVYFFESLNTMDDKVSWIEKAKKAGSKRARAVIFITESSELVVPDPVLQVDGHALVGIPVVFVSRGELGDIVIAECHAERTVKIEFERPPTKEY